jgi:ribosomal-protein-alanine N-acetyltransferase
MKFDVYLRAFEIEDSILINKWRNDAEIQFLLGGNKYFVSLEREKKWVEEKIFNNNQEIYWAICLDNNTEMIGYISLNKIDLLNRNAFWGGIVIGDKKNRQLQKSIQAVYLMLEHGFSQLGLHKIYGQWLECNEVSLLLGDFFKFQIEGILRDHIYKNNKFNNMIIKSLLKSEFEENRTKYLRL